ncbi:MAG: cation-transporting P-type ATPase [Betaproteobacteria bacterium]
MDHHVDGLMPGAEERLSGAEAARRLAVYGPNEAAPVRRLSAVVQLVHLFANPLVRFAVGRAGR